MATPNQHQPVLLPEVLDLLKPQPGEVYLDLTAGLGGHAAAVLKRTGSSGKAVLVDRDPAAVKILAQKFKGPRIINSDYLSAINELQKAGFKADVVLMDLGLSSLQLADDKRGFSFSWPGPLDMRMGPAHQQLTASKLVNSLGERQLADIIYRYGEERRSRPIARAIVGARPINDSARLGEIVAGALGGRRGRIHPATRTFQALRIAVNDELNQLEQALPVLTELLAPGGRLAIISFHSLEDRIAKHYIRQAEELTPLTKKPLSGQNLDASNPRARSAKLRAAIKNKK